MYADLESFTSAVCSVKYMIWKWVDWDYAVECVTKHCTLSRGCIILRNKQYIEKTNSVPCKREQKKAYTNKWFLTNQQSNGKGSFPFSLFDRKNLIC